MLEVSLRHLRDASGDRRMVLSHFLRLMICHQGRHLESTLNQFISFVFNHPTDRSDRPRGEETTPFKSGSERN